ncbi:hypothetical protein AOQ88_01225 [Candidatus Riesia sp. GBBU]|nr:hypothetical protein AOQ88_01225 [Candidatus Riesia sp. GBBU]
MKNNLKEKSLLIGVVSGEVSGDIAGANLIESFKKKFSNVKFVGICGSKMKRKGCKAIYESNDICCFGIIEVLSKIPKILIIRSKIFSYFIKKKIDMFIGIDFPDFNIPLEKKLKENGIKTIHYISPSIWAWRKRRIFQIKKSVDLMLVFFNFEKDLYKKYKVPCECVGHFISDKISYFPNKNYARKKLNLEQKKIYLSILPGSRILEIKRLSLDFLKAAQILQKSFSNLKILVLIINKECYKQFMKIFKRSKLDLDIKIIFDRSNIAMIASDAAVVTSGTATLECMLAKCPMVVCYKVNFFTYLVIKIFFNIRFISLPNLLGNKKIINEFVQYRCNPKKISDSIKSILNNKNKVKFLKKSFLKLHKIIRFNTNTNIVDSIVSILFKN